MIKHLTMNELEAGLPAISNAPHDNGTLEMLVLRPGVDERQVVSAGKLTVAEGLAGDSWLARGSKHTPDGSAIPDAQITLMNARVIDLLSPDRDRWPLAGDQLFVDMDLSSDNLPPGQRLAVGTAVLEITALPHTGCKKFAQRFGVDALKFISSPIGKAGHFRGIYAKVVQDGTLRAGDTISKIAS